MWKKLSGYKVYIIATGMVVYASLGLILHLHSSDTAMQIFLQAMSVAGLRHAIETTNS